MGGLRLYISLVCEAVHVGPPGFPAEPVQSQVHAQHACCPAEAQASCTHKDTASSSMHMSASTAASCPAISNPACLAVVDPAQAVNSTRDASKLTQHEARAQSCEHHQHGRTALSHLGSRRASGRATNNEHAVGGQWKWWLGMRLTRPQDPIVGTFDGSSHFY